MSQEQHYKSAIIKAIEELKDRRGSTATAIKKYLLANPITFRPPKESLTVLPFQESTFKRVLKEMEKDKDIVKKSASGSRYVISEARRCSFSVEAGSAQPRHGRVIDLWRNGQLCDAQIVSSDGRSFEAHRLVLAANSDYMKALLAEDRFKDSTDCPIRLPDVSSRAVEFMLEWMYTGICTLTSVSDTIEFLETACRLQCQDLIEQLESAICKTIDSETCLGMWNVGERLSLDELAKKAREVVLQSFGSLSISEEITDLTLERIVDLIKDDRLVVKKEEEVHAAAISWVNAQSGNNLSDDAVKRLFACVRYPLIDGDFLSDTVLDEPLLKNNPIYLRTVARSLGYPDRAKKRVGMPLRWEDVQVGVTVRVMDDVEELERLCDECAPGAVNPAFWVPAMKEFAGKCFNVTKTFDSSRSAKLVQPNGITMCLPFTALRFA